MTREHQNTLYYGDNLDVLRRYIPDESVDLVYLDPPFNSARDYNVLFKAQDGARAAAQIRVFEDTWRWDQSAASAYEETVEVGGKISEALQGFRTFLGDSDMLAYLSMMAPRLAELRRVMNESASLYLHCDPNASHYLKILLDAVFGPEQFLSEITWKRTGTHSSANRWGPVHDVILMYAKARGSQVWNRPYAPLSDEHRSRHYRMADAEGRRYDHGELTAPGIRHGRSGAVWRGFDVSALGRHWSTTVEKLDQLHAAGRIYLPTDGSWPRLIRYEDESPGRAMGDVWDDIPPLNMQARERLGFPTQKPEALLERIVAASSNEGAVVLDPFCGCGTTIAAAEKLNRRWIGIDVTHLAINLIRTRLRAAYADRVAFEVVGEPVSGEDAAELARSDPFQFQAWALGLVGARPAELKKGADKGIDGRLYFHDGTNKGTRQAILSVKAGHVTSSHVRDLVGVLTREKAEIGALISFEKATAHMRKEAASAGFYESPWGKHPKIQLLTVADLLDGKKLDMPQTAGTNRTYKQAPRAKQSEAEHPELFTE